MHQCGVVPSKCVFRQFLYEKEGNKAEMKISDDGLPTAVCVTFREPKMRVQTQSWKKLPKIPCTLWMLFALLLALSHSLKSTLSRFSSTTAATHCERIIIHKREAENELFFLRFLIYFCYFRTHHNTTTTDSSSSILLPGERAFMADSMECG